MSEDDLCRRYREMFGEDLFHPRDEWDVDAHPESLRGKALALMDTVAEVQTRLDTAIAELPWYRRWPARATLVFVRARARLRHMTAKLRERQRLNLLRRLRAMWPPMFVVFMGVIWLSALGGWLAWWEGDTALALGFAGVALYWIWSLWIFVALSDDPK